MSTMLNDQQKALREEQLKLIHDAEEIMGNKAATAEDKEKLDRMFERMAEVNSDLEKYAKLTESKTAVAQYSDRQGYDPKTPNQAEFKNLGEFLQAVYVASFKGMLHPGLKIHSDPNEPDTGKALNNGWLEAKDLVEAIGASGGYLVPNEQSTQLLAVPGTPNVVRQRATVIPMRSRAIQFPVLDQTGTTSGQPNWFGGMIAQWTEEATEKNESEPSFRQKLLVAYKLAIYTEASDELLGDSIISLEALLSSLFQQTTDWYEEEAFINGTGAGQPLGVVNAAALNAPTLVVAPQAANAVSVTDFANMLEAFMGVDPVWMISRQWMNNIIEIAGPAANPSYVFIDNVRESIPQFLFGYPIVWSEHMPLPGVTGSILLADWSKYLIGDRQATTIDASKHYQFRRDVTAWRSVHRVGGNPWMSAPFTYSDGSTQVSPFVVLGDTVAT